MLIGLLARPALSEGEAARCGALPYAALTVGEIAALQGLYDGKLDDWYLEGTETGYYVGWRLIITGDGKWNAFVAGD